MHRIHKKGKNIITTAGSLGNDVGTHKTRKKKGLVNSFNSITSPINQNATSVRDPGTMSDGDIIGEISTILARGYLRLILGSRNDHNSLDDRAYSSAPCDRVVNDNRTDDRKEQAA